MSAEEITQVPIEDVVTPVAVAAEARAREIGRPSLACIGVPVAFDDPLALLHATQPTTAGWWAAGGIRAAGADVAAFAEAMGPTRFSTLAESVERWFDGAVIEGRAPLAFVGGAYRDARPGEGWDGFPNAAAWVPELCAIRDKAGTWLVASTLVFAGDAAAAAAHLVTVLARGADDVLRTMGDIVIRGGGGDDVCSTLTPDDAGWDAGVTDVLNAIEAGSVEKAVLARRCHRAADEHGADDPWTVAARLTAAYPECFAYGVHMEGATFVGASPELLISRDGATVRSAPAAGTVARGADGLETDKSRHEQVVVADAVASVLADYCDQVRRGSAMPTSAGPMEHLSTAIEGDLHGSPHVLELVGALHPTPAVGGVSLEAARSLQDAHEGFDRGWYAGPVGVVTPDGDGSFAIALRGALLHAGGVDLFAGAGIVAGSDPAAERAEIALKLSAAAAAL